MAPKPYGPNYLEVVKAEIRRYPGINLAGEDHERGRLVDAVACTLNGGGPDGPWGRKARRDGDRASRNGDGLTYHRTDGRHEIVDILRGLDDPPEDRVDYAGWDPKGDFAPGENGYWLAADPVAPPAAPWDAFRDYIFGLIGHKPGDPADDYQAVLRKLHADGMPINARPGERPDFSRFKGIKVIIDGDGRGNPRGTLQLPTDTPDGLGYFTHEVQIIRDRTPGQPPFVGPFDYDWIDRGGPPVVFTGQPGEGSGGTGNGGGGNGGGTDPEVQAALRELRNELHGLIVAKENLEGRLEAVEGGGSDVLERLGRIEAKLGRLVTAPARTDSRGPGPLAHSHTVPRLAVVDSNTLPPPKE